MATTVVLFVPQQRLRSTELFGRNFPTKVWENEYFNSFKAARAEWRSTTCSWHCGRNKYDGWFRSYESLSSQIEVKNEEISNINIYHTSE